MTVHPSGYEIGLAKISVEINIRNNKKQLKKYFILPFFSIILLIKGSTFYE
tara:strand:- start:668 stop:820 length:153 start_codon:yes stop_codon:yes gene_type:complete